MPKGPRGEKRPKSSVSSMVNALEVATGIKKEEYSDESSTSSDDKYSSYDDDEDDGDEYQIAALETTALEKPGKPRKKPKKGRSKP